MKKIKVFAIIMIMVMVLTGSTPSNVEAKTKASITVTNKSTGKKVGKKLTLKKGKKVQLKVKYGKKVVTKKAKYKTSDKKVITVSKKGKITAKAVGTCTVKVTYKKNTKKIKVTVKARAKTQSTAEATTETRTEPTIDEILYGPGYDTPCIKASEEDCIRYRQMVIDHNQNDPNPSCAHEWVADVYRSDIGNISDNFGELYKDHLFLHRIWCNKCGTYAITNSVPYLEAMTYTSDDFAKLILCYTTDSFSDDIITGSIKKGTQRGINHKHKMVYEYQPEGNGRWGCECLCKYCEHMDN